MDDSKHTESIETTNLISNLMEKGIKLWILVNEKKVY